MVSVEPEQEDWDSDVGDVEDDSAASRPLRPGVRPSRTLIRRPSQRGNRKVDPQFGSCEEWVNSWLLPMWTRPLGHDSLTWCPQWWRHPEAVARLTALWLAWEQLRLEPGTAMSVWWRDHADHHLPVLLGAQNIFKGCTPERHTQYPVDQLPSDPAPPGTFD